jgi:AcrR family transcriptional regulator
VNGITGERRKFRREGEGPRREALVAAALAIVAESGPEAATVRAIATRAGVTGGLIRHYFATKEDLIRTAYTALMDRMLTDSTAMLDRAPQDDPVARLAAFVAASLSPPVTGAETVGLWAAFIRRACSDPAILAVHEATYLAYRDRLQAMIAALPRPADPATLRAQAIACNGVIDGLWLEASLLPDTFAPGEMARIGLASVGAILGLDLTAASPPPLTTKGATE